jgi:hypothetical protein
MSNIASYKNTILALKAIRDKMRKDMSLIGAMSTGDIGGVIAQLMRYDNECVEIVIETNHMMINDFSEHPATRDVGISDISMALAMLISQNIINMNIRRNKSHNASDEVFWKTQIKHLISYSFAMPPLLDQFNAAIARLASHITCIGMATNHSGTNCSNPYFT